MTNPRPEQFTAHHISAIDTGDRWGIPDTPHAVGVLRTTGGSTGMRMTLIVDIEYVQTLAEAVEILEGEIICGPSAIHWMRRGWPNEWQTHCEPNAWLQVVDGHVPDALEGGTA